LLCHRGTRSLTQNYECVLKVAEGKPEIKGKLNKIRLFRKGNFGIYNN